MTGCACIIEEIVLALNRFSYDIFLSLHPRVPISIGSRSFGCGLEAPNELELIAEYEALSIRCVILEGFSDLLQLDSRTSILVSVLSLVMTRSNIPSPIYWWQWVSSFKTLLCVSQHSLSASVDAAGHKHNAHDHLGETRLWQVFWIFPRCRELPILHKGIPARCWSICGKWKSKCNAIIIHRSCGWVSKLNRLQVMLNYNYPTVDN